MKNNSAIGVFETHTLAEDAVKELKLGKVDIGKLSIIGRDQHTDEHVVGYYNTGERMMYWGRSGAFWGGLWGMLFGAGIFIVPGIGPLLVAGPLVALIAAALQGAAVVGGLEAVS
ncbi:permease [bacterium]|nr:permease [bacterium]